MHTLETLSIIETTHISSVDMMIFIDRGTKLVTIGSRQHNSVLVYSMNDYQLACASHLPHGRLVGLSEVKPYFRDVGNSTDRVLVACTSKSVLLLDINTNLTYTAYQLDSKPT